MSTCDCCGEEVQLLEVIGNADQEPWQVCARCLLQDLAGDNDQAAQDDVA